MLTSTDPLCIDCYAPLIRKNPAKRAPLRCSTCIQAYKNDSRKAIRRNKPYRGCLACKVPMPPAGGFSYCEACRPKAAEHIIRIIQCPVCEVQFETDKANQVYCSELCRQRYKTAKRLQRPYTRVPTERDRARWTLREARRKAAGKPRARTGGSWRVMRARVLVEEPVCWLCELPIDPALRYPDRMSGSVDHITPVALGGTNDRGNLHAAHFSCNNRRNAPRNGQLARTMIRA